MELNGPESSRNDLELLGAVQAIVGEEHALPGAGLFPEGIDGVVPRVVAFPAGADEIAALLRYASRHRLAVVPFGGATQLGLGNPPARADIALSLSRLDGIVAYEPADMTITVQAGITLEKLQRHLALHDQWLPFDPPLPGRATIGGIIATREAGPLRQAFRGVADRLLGIEVVTADGKRAKAGGRVVKNVSGYEMGRLYAGSLGTLAVIVEAAFKVQPRFEAASALVAVVEDLDCAGRAIQALLDSDAEPVMLELLGPIPFGPDAEALRESELIDLLEQLSAAGLAATVPAEGDLSPRAARGPAGPAALLIAGYAGTPKEVTWQLDEAARRLAHLWGAGLIASQRVPWQLAHKAALKAHRRDAEAAFDAAASTSNVGGKASHTAARPADMGAGAEPLPAGAVGAGPKAVQATASNAADPTVTCRVHLRPSHLTRFLAELFQRDGEPGALTANAGGTWSNPAGSSTIAAAGASSGAAGGSPTFAAHAGCGIVRIHLPSPPGGDEELARRIDLWRQRSAEAGGFLVVERASPGLKRQVSVFGPQRPDFFLHRSIKERMDPYRILNPGRFIGGL